MQSLRRFASIGGGVDEKLPKVTSGPSREAIRGMLLAGVGRVARRRRRRRRGSVGRAFRARPARALLRDVGTFMLEGLVDRGKSVCEDGEEGQEQRSLALALHRQSWRPNWSHLTAHTVPPNSQPLIPRSAE